MHISISNYIHCDPKKFEEYNNIKVTIRGFDRRNIYYILVLILLRESNLITAIPAKYKKIRGPVINHIVIPLPSGVNNAPRTINKMTAYPKLFFQKLCATNPDLVMAHIIIGS